MSLKYVIVVEPDDGGLSAVGPYPTELAATLDANDIETDGGPTCHVLPLEFPEA